MRFLRRKAELGLTAYLRLPGRVAYARVDRRATIPKQEYTAEFKELAVKRVRDGQAVGAVAKELGLIEQTLRNWVKAHAAGKLNAPGTRKITPEEMELSRLRAENIRLRRECEILKKATAYFAKDAL